MITFYHNPRCSKSRQALKLLEERKELIQIVEYLKNPVSKEQLVHIIEMLAIKPVDLVRKTEAYFKTNLKGRELTDAEWVEEMIDNPKLIERPIAIKDGKAVIGRPPEKILEIL